MTHRTEWTAKWARFSVQEVLSHSFHILTHEKWFSKFFLTLEVVQRELNKLTSPRSSQSMCIWEGTLSICFWFHHTEPVRGLCCEGCLMLRILEGFERNFILPFTIFVVSQTLIQVNKLGPLRTWALTYIWNGEEVAGSWQIKSSLALGARWHLSPKGRKGWGWTGKLYTEDRLSFCGWVIPFQKSAQANAILEGSWGLPCQLGKAVLSISAAQVFPFEGREVTELFRNSMCIHLNASLPALMCWGDQTGIAGYNWELIKAALLQTFCGSFHSSLIKNKREEESFTAMSHLRYNGRNSKRLMRQNKADIMKAMSTH